LISIQKGVLLKALKIVIPNEAPYHMVQGEARNLVLEIVSPRDASGLAMTNKTSAYTPL
jgi:hypothetical protein